MSEELELKLFQKIEELEKEIRELKGEEVSKVPIYSFSKIRFKDLESLVNIQESFDDKIFETWFNSINLTDENVIDFLSKLLIKEGKYIKYYNEENLKIKFIAQIINLVDFNISENLKDFYEETLTYQTENFIFTGNVDFLVSKGVKKSEKPYFFIQEFKKGKENSDPEPQLLTELIAGVELNNWQSIKGAYIVGAIWNFVILERIEKHKYIYYVSVNFDSSKIEDLKGIYKNLLYVKNEIIKLNNGRVNESINS